MGDLRSQSRPLVFSIFLFPQTKKFTSCGLSSPGVSMGTGEHTAAGGGGGGGGNLTVDLASHPHGNRNISSRFMQLKPELSAGMAGHLARKQA